MEWLESLLGCFKASRLYRTPDVKGSGIYYVNAVVQGETDLDQETLDALFKAYELACGRNAEARKHGIVPIDIDIVMWDSEIIRAWDYRQVFFRIGYSELAGSVIKC